MNDFALAFSVGSVVLAVASLVSLGLVLRASKRQVGSLQLQLSALIKTVGRQVYVWHPQSGAVLACSAGRTLAGAGGYVAMEKLLNLFELRSRDELEHHLALLHQSKHNFSFRCFSAKDSEAIRVSGSELEKPKGYYVITLEDAQADVTFETQMQELKESSEFLTAFTHSFPYPLWHRDPDDKLDFVNDAYVRYVGKPRELILTENLEIAQHKAKTQPDPSAGFPRRHVVVNSNRLLVELQEIPMPDGSRLGVALDVTLIEQAQSDLVRHISAHNEVLEYLSTCIAVYGSDMRLKYFNNSYARLVGSLSTWLHTQPTLGEVLEALHQRRLIPEFADFQSYKKKQLDMFTSLISPVQELLHLPDDRTLRTVTAPHPLGGLLFMFEDVTDALTLERQYNTLIAVQKATLDHLHEGVAVFTSDNRLKLSNPAFSKIWNLPPDDVLPGKTLPTLLERTKDLFFAGGAWDKIRDRIIDNVTNRLSKSGKIKRSDGSVLDFAYVPLPDGANMLSYLDITDRYRVERALRERNEALEEADRLKSEFIANVSYELRAPLNTVIGFTEILMNQYFGELNHRQVEYAQGILDSSKQLLSLINGILDLASMEAGRMILRREMINIPYLLRTVFGLLEKKAREHGQELTYMCSPDVDNMVGDERQLKQVLYNLVVNSIKFTPEGGKIHINAELESGHVLCLYVEDNGLGIPVEDHERVFGKFERIEHFPNVGAGLGLALVKSFVELHNGRVEIRSAPNEGTRVTCHIPLQPIEVLESPSSSSLAAESGASAGEFTLESPQVAAAPSL